MQVQFTCAHMHSPHHMHTCTYTYLRINVCLYMRELNQDFFPQDLGSLPQKNTLLQKNVLPLRKESARKNVDENALLRKNANSLGKENALPPLNNALSQENALPRGKGKALPHQESNFPPHHQPLSSHIDVTSKLILCCMCVMLYGCMSC